MSYLACAPDDACFPHVHIIPKPSRLRQREGFFQFTHSTVIVAAAEARSEALLLSERLTPALGFALPVEQTPAGAASRLEFTLDATLAALGDEGYRLSVSPARVTIAAASSAGLFYGLQTLLQLLPSSMLGAEICEDREWVVPCIEIEDSPRFVWRGTMLDVSRHFMPTEFLCKFIDTLALHKLNILHLHLTDDQGWRIEIKKYPKLTRVGAFREETLVGFAEKSPTRPDFDPEEQVFDGTPYGDFYTQEQMREVVEYARRRHVTIVPEIEMPGHAQAAVAAYPELGCTDMRVDVSPRWGIHAELFNPLETTIAFLQDVLSEVMDVFPSPFIHVGGDEAVKTQWRESTVAQTRIRELGLSDEEELQSYYIRRMDEFLTLKGRRLIGWDEILQGGLAENAAVMSWRGEVGGVTAAAAGHDVVMAPYSHTYLDYYQTEDWAHEPLAFNDIVTLETVYAYEPVPAKIPAHLEHHVLGAQGQLWTEYMPTPAQVEYMAFPRLTALSEVTWSSRECRDYSDFRARLSVHVKRLAALGVAYRPLDVPTAVRRAAEVEEAVTVAG
ncbi:MAG: beta-N-acetylhexosaminidase [Capsulimonas sp.]|uniref:beta-N-acetylhexosaminidase n=1 Tax=Capsulimonas sp. TaxID=2494211 RepID=UPI0032679E12